MEAIEERTRKLGQEGEIEEQNQEARNEEIKSGDERDGGVCRAASWRGFAVTARALSVHMHDKSGTL